MFTGIRRFKKKSMKKFKEEFFQEEKIKEKYIINECKDIGYIGLTLYDKLNNDGFTRLITKLYTLEKNENYESTIYYLKKKIRKKNYITPQFDYTSNGRVAEISFKNDDLIRDLSITSTQINNEEALIAYTFSFKKLIYEDNVIYEYVKKNFDKLIEEHYAGFYTDLEVIKKHDSAFTNYLYECFTNLFQQYINRNLYTSIGKHYTLPKISRFLCEKIDDDFREELKDPFLQYTYKDKDNSFYVIDYTDCREGISINQYIEGNSWSNNDFLTLFSEHKMEAYLTFFYNIELKELENKIGKFLNSKRRTFSSKDYKWLLNKKRAVSEINIYSSNKKRMKFINLYGYSKRAPKYFIENNAYTNRFNKLYSQNLDYLSAVHNSNYNSIIMIVTLITLILTIVGLLITN